MLKRLFHSLIPQSVKRFVSNIRPGVAAFAKEHWIPLNRNDLKLLKFRNRHAGKRAFIIGMGPSLRVEDLTLLKDEITFGCNKCYLAFDSTPWRPTYYVVEDALVWENNRDTINQLKGFPRFFPKSMRHDAVETNEVAFINIAYPQGDNRDFSLNPLTGLFGGYTVTYLLIQLAVSMGISEIYLLGMDFSFKTPPKLHDYIEGFGMYVSEGEVNHFVPNYRSPGERWVEPNLENQLKSFEFVVSFAAQKGLQIKNATRGGALEVFERVDLDSLLEKEELPEDTSDFLWLESGRTEKNYWLDLWRYRELFFTLAWRDIAVRYRQTIAGATWALIQPFVTMVIMTLVFSKLAGLPSRDDAPYGLMVFAGLLPWQFFANSLSNASSSIVTNANLISKTYFPRLIVPISSIAVAFVDFLVAFAILIGMMVWYEYSPTWRIVALPGFILFAFLAALGPGLILTALTVRFRDFRFVIPFILQVGLYISPVGYSSDIVRQKFGDTLFVLYSINPMVSVIKGFRWAILGGDSRIYLPGFLVSIALVLILLAVGLWYFRKTEKAFADVI